MASIVLTGSTDRFLRLAAQITAAAHESSGTIALTLDNGVTGSIAAVTSPSGKRRDS